MARVVYKTNDGKRVPSVTTVLGILGLSKDALMYWAWQQGCDGKDFRETSKGEADVGTVAHGFIEAELKNQPYSLDLILAGRPPEMRAKVDACISAWHEWREQSQLQMIGSEVSLVSERYRYGGTLDIATVMTRRGILDLKTGSGTYADHLIQVVAYGMLWEEAHSGEAVEEYHLLRLGKTDGSFHHHRYPADALECAREAFLRARELYDLVAPLKKMGG